VVKGPSPERRQHEDAPISAIHGDATELPGKTKSERVSPSKGPENGHLKLRCLLRSDTQAGPIRRCPPDGYDVS
jgi:hypothetical protein